MPISFSDHAKHQIKRRRISLKRIIETARSPEEIISSFKNRRLRRRSFGDKILQVVTVTEGSKITIVSAYYLRRR